MAKAVKDNTDGDTAKSRPKAKPRDYVVCRETTLVEVGNLNTSDLPADTRVLIVLGPATAKTPKAARIEVAKTKCDSAELEATGVDLNAVAARALDAGRKTVKLETRPSWDA